MSSTDKKTGDRYADEIRENDPGKEGHTTEWQDRARVVLDAKEAVKDDASPNQSPVPGEDRPSEKESRERNKNDDPVY